MQRLILWLGLVPLGLGIASLATAQTSSRPHMDFLAGLRRENMPDLAFQYLNELKASNPPPEIAVILPLEYARTYIDLAGDETDENKRAAQMSNAKRELENFLKASPNHELAPQANVELARLYSVQGRTQIRKASRLEDKAKEEEAMKLARTPLLQAIAKFKETEKLIADQLKNTKSDKAAQLKDFERRTRLDQGITYYYLGEAYVGAETKDVQERGKQYKTGMDILEKLMYEEEKLPICYVAKAWYGQSAIKKGDAGVGEKVLKELVEKKEPYAAAGVRVARYFIILNSFSDVAKLEKDTTDWLRDYAAYRETAEGLGARYYLANAKRQIGFAGLSFSKPKDKEKEPPKILGITTAAKAKLEDAARLFKELADSDNEFSERAQRNRSQILVTIADAEGHGDYPPLESLANFERAFLMAQVQVARFMQFRAIEGKTDEMIKKEETQRFRSAMRYLEYALALANPARDNIRDIFNAQLFLVDCYLQMKMYPQAAILAEYVARENPKMNKASTAGAVSMRAYNIAQIELRKAKEKAESADEKLWETKFQADVQRLNVAAAMLIKQWPNEAAADEARHILAFYLARDKKLQDAWDKYADIKVGYPALQQARLELASVMFTMIYPAEEKDPVKFNQITKDRLRQYDKQWKRTLVLLEGVPAPIENAPIQDALAYVSNRLELSRMYQLQGTQAKAQKVGEDLLKTVEGFTEITKEQKEQSVLGARAVVLSSIRAQAYDEFKGGNHAKVAELLDPRIDEIQKDFAKEVPADPTISFNRLRKTQRDTVVLALQSCVQDGKVKRGSELLELLEKSGGTPDDNIALLQSLVASVRTQIDELTAAKKDAEAKSLKDGFAQLLESLLERGENLSIKMRLFLAQGLSGIEAYAKSAEQLETIIKMQRPPAPTEPDMEKATEAQKAKYKRDLEDHEGFARFVRQAQFMLARNYRFAKDYPKALAAFEKVIGPIKPPKEIFLPKEKQALYWGYGSVFMRKEKATMMEERALNAAKADRLKFWGEAVQEWVAISKTFAPQLPGIAQELSPEEKARKIFLTTFTQKPEEESCQFSMMDFAWLNLQHGLRFAEDSANAKAQAEANAQKRANYFELFFEQKRCTVLAFKNLGTDGTGGDAQKLKDTFAKLAKDFADLQSPAKNPDLSPDLKKRIQELIASVDDLKAEFQKLQTGN